MKVVLIANFPPKASPEADHAYHLAEHLAQRGLEVHVVTTKGSTQGGHPRVVVHPLMQRWSWSELPRLLLFLWRCSPCAILLVYVFGGYGLSMITFLPSVARRILPSMRFVTLFEDAVGITPFVQKATWEHGLVARAIRKATLWLTGPAEIDPLYGTLLRDSTGLIAVSDRVAQVLAERNRKAKDKTAVIPAPAIIFMCPEYGTAARRQRRASLGLGPDDFLVAYFGYLYPTKGVETLLVAFQQLCQRQLHARLVVIGGTIPFPGRPQYFEELRQTAEVLGLNGQVHWTGGFTWDSDVGSQFLRAADLCVLPYETGVCIHNSSFAVAATHGLPIITTRGAMVEPPFVHEDNVFLCPPQNAEALAAAMEQLIASPDLRERLAAGARRLAQALYSWDEATDRTIAQLRSS
jgi:glycosyltransferase involved in cell wall biosynthesis